MVIYPPLLGGFFIEIEELFNKGTFFITGLHAFSFGEVVSLFFCGAILPERQNFHNRMSSTCGTFGQWCGEYLLPQVAAYALPAVMKILPFRAKPAKFTFFCSLGTPPKKTS
ncbi:MAG: hypothetical protein LBT04_03130 [Prevotellaceae bacterium]|jgi:hypothetical protein|nr:hypothetical protein [Prevotellaceae bacterium]